MLSQISFIISIRKANSNTPRKKYWKLEKISAMNAPSPLNSTPIFPANSGLMISFRRSHQKEQSAESRSVITVVTTTRPVYFPSSSFTISRKIPSALKITIIYHVFRITSVEKIGISSPSLVIAQKICGHTRKAIRKTTEIPIPNMVSPLDICCSFFGTGGRSSRPE